MMKLLFQLSREHATLPKAEVYSVLEGEGVKWVSRIEDSQAGLLLLEVKSKNTSFASRLALTQKVVEVVSLRKNLEEVAGEVYPRIKKVKSFAVRCESNTVERVLGALLHEKGLKVNLTKPEKTVVVYRIKDFFVAGFEIPIEKNFEMRHPLKRPFFHPTSMKPKTARMLVNLACVKKGKTLLDPFCGAGGILIETGLLGLKAYGWDLDKVMLRGCEKNVRYFGVKATLQKHDALSKHAIKIDAVVTDPPYGKSSTTLGINPGKLYNNFVANIKHNLKKNGKLVIVLPEQYKIKHNGFKLENKYKIRVHKSLTRVIWILKRT